MLTIVAHATFLILAAGLALNIGHTLWRQGGGRLLAVACRRHGLGGGTRFGGPVVLGFGLVAVGAALLLTVFGDPPETVLQVTLFVGMRLGAFLIVLGVTYFKCLTILTRAAAVDAAVAPMVPADPPRPRRAREDPLDRVFEAARLDAPSGL